MINQSETKSNILFSSVKYLLDNEGPIIIAYQLKSPENMGHIIRLACNFGCKKVLFVGNKENVRESKIKKVAGAAAGQVDWIFCEEENWKMHIPEDYAIAALETTEDSVNVSKVKLPEKLAVVLGNEISGLTNSVLQQCSRFYHIPMIGAVKSMNVSHACSVALYEWVRQYHIESK